MLLAGQPYPSVRLLSTGDVDADGDGDFVTVWNNGELHWYRNDGVAGNGTVTLSRGFKITNAPGFRLMSS